MDPTADLQNVCLTYVKKRYFLIMKEILCNVPNYKTLLAHKYSHQMLPNSTKIPKVLRGSMPPEPLARLHETDLQDSFLHESVEPEDHWS